MKKIVVLGLCLFSTRLEADPEYCRQLLAKINTSETTEQAIDHFVQDITLLNPGEAILSLQALTEIKEGDDFENQLESYWILFQAASIGAVRASSEETVESLTSTAELVANEAIEIIEHQTTFLSLSFLQQLRNSLQNPSVIDALDRLAAQAYFGPSFSLAKWVAITEKLHFEKYLDEHKRNIRNYVLSVQSAADRRLFEIKQHIDRKERWPAIRDIQSFFVQYIFVAIEAEIFIDSGHQSGQPIALVSIDTIEAMFSYFHERLDSYYLESLRVHLWLIVYDRLGYYENRVVDEADNHQDAADLISKIQNVRTVLDELLEPGP